MQLFDSVKALFMVLFFYKAILLTPSPIALTENWIEIIPSEPIGAITSDAALYVDITGIVKNLIMKN